MNRQATAPGKRSTRSSSCAGDSTYVPGALRRAGFVSQVTRNAFKNSVHFVNKTRTPRPCLDEQGLALSSPWLQLTGSLVAEAVTVWPKVWAILTEKQKWAGCRELGEELSEQWQCVKHCLSAYKKFGKAQILAVQQLQSVSGRWRHLDDLHHNHRVLTEDEYSSLTSW